jgi:hypothetical protein
MRRFVWSVFIFISFSINAQERYYSEPLKIPILLTGSFAELRTNHFHSGIDIRTEGRTGVPVYPTATGYVSRIVVSPFGFGNALYIDHPNGTTSLYGHLERFNDTISKYVKNNQYRNKSFSTDISVPPGMFVVSKNEVVAYSGNSGGSGGPHLHFEIRDTKSEETINPLEYQLKIKDDISPKITGLRVYSLDGQSHVGYSNKNQNFETVFYEGKYHIKDNPVLPVYGEIGFGIEAADYLDGSLSKCGINYLSLKIDGEEHFSFELNKFSFSDSRYINSLIDYESFINSQRRFYKTWKDPGNKFDIYKIRNGDGSFDASDNQTHKVEIFVMDSYKNQSVLEFTIKSVYKDLVSTEKKNCEEFYYNESNTFKAEGIKLYCPEGSFYTNFCFEYVVTNTETNLKIYSNIHQVHYNTTPIHNSIKLSIKAEKLPEELEGKALIVAIDKNTGARSSVGGSLSSGYVSTEIKSFGNFAVTVDTVPPTIRSLSIKDKNTLTEPGQLRFRISDNLSGIKNYTGTIDGEWVLFEYDAKNNLLCYKFDKERMKLNRKHQLKLIVTDDKDNFSTYEASFFK